MFISVMILSEFRMERVTGAGSWRWVSKCLFHKLNEFKLKVTVKLMVCDLFPVSFLSVVEKMQNGVKTQIYHPRSTKNIIKIIRIQRTLYDVCYACAASQLLLLLFIKWNEYKKERRNAQVISSQNSSNNNKSIHYKIYHTIWENSSKYERNGLSMHIFIYMGT